MNQPQSVDHQAKLLAASKKLVGVFFGWMLFGAMAAYQGWATDDMKMIADAILSFGLAGLTWNVARLNGAVSGIIGELKSQSEKSSKADET